MDETVRLGGMALGNGVMVHGPTSWACAVREPDGTIKVASARKGFRASGVGSPLLRGPARLLEAMLVLPAMRRELPEARLPFERKGVLGAMLATAVVTRGVRSSRLRPLVKELAAGVVALAPAALSLRGGELAAYHGAEHVAIGRYEHGGHRATKEHERCGSHLVGPIILTTAIGNSLAARAPERLRGPARAASAVAALAAATEMFGWMVRHPDHPASRALAWPGHELQHRLSTEEPSPEQLEVAELALATCLKLEHGHANAR
jgi:uncharacterized protein YqhQ